MNENTRPTIRAVNQDGVSSTDSSHGYWLSPKSYSNHARSPTYGHCTGSWFGSQIGSAGAGCPDVVRFHAYDLGCLLNAHAPGCIVIGLP